MYRADDHPHLVPLDGSFQLAQAPTRPPEKRGRKHWEKRLASTVSDLRTLQRVLYASDHHAVLLVFQAMDAAGKDGTIRAVLSGLDPAGCQVFSFKRPSSEEIDHDFLWRTARSLPERGRIGIFNRSYYEEVLVVRVHPGILDHQRLPHRSDGEELWRERLESIADHERHLARNGTVILKFWLNVSRDEQRRRFLARIDDPARQWKFEAGDVRERGHWDAYMAAYEDALRATSTPWAPWYAIPADNKGYMRFAVADIVRRTLMGLGLRYPELSDEERAEMLALREKLLAEP
ncbi:MAG: polyphosphate kinase 2 family protein [Myxococcales bacterium]|nr:polyphosphate kinase 2 family protein [Myxococcales bacterium]MCB9547468.1 polyphosphate kinase 2 family protein [Myxococcales bacterium]